MNIIGIDIGGTKCAVILGWVDKEGKPTIIGKKVIQTSEHPDPYLMISRLQNEIERLLDFYQTEIKTVSSIGISCGGPLDSNLGVILSPPNLPGWNEVPIVKLFTEKYGIPTAIQNDANASALAEWQFGAGRGTQNMAFLTFGTGLGAGLILNGKLYAGTNDNAGEVGHIRLSDFGPVGYGKAGSFEGFCSGSGIAQLARTKAMEKFQMGGKVAWCDGISELQSITAQVVADAANSGDPLALEIFEICGTYLGKGLSILIDILNPERIVIGSIFVRAGHLLIPSLEKTLQVEALPLARKVCRIVPAELDEQIGDLASLSVAVNQLETKKVIT
ncbi:MAG TPA: sugar kinase [Prolixibacteraceae bacterium]|nr:sugar kinase [Prolixibacteraceae bacterium]